MLCFSWVIIHFLGQRCVKWSVKWVHLTSLQWIRHIILHQGSRASCLPPANLSSSYIHLSSSPCCVAPMPPSIRSSEYAWSSRQERDDLQKFPSVFFNLLWAPGRACFISVWFIIDHQKVHKPMFLYLEIVERLWYWYKAHVLHSALMWVQINISIKVETPL